MVLNYISLAGKSLLSITISTSLQIIPNYECPWYNVLSYNLHKIHDVELSPT